MNNRPHVDIILLAAGQSSRLGRPKQLLPIHDKMLLELLIGEAIAAEVENVFVVLGAYYEEILPKIEHLKVHIVKNEHWQEGMSSSIHCGIKAIKEQEKTPDAVILMLCDQPFVKTYVINELIDKYVAKNQPIVNCNYGGSIGPPVLFDRAFFTDLELLENPDGAKEVIQKYKTKVAQIDFADGIKDIDTEEDYQNFLKENNIL